jgi:hypothetical protein
MADSATRVHHLPENSSSVPPSSEGQASQKEPNNNKLAKWTAVLSALLACFAAIVGYQAAGTGNQAVIKKNEMVAKIAQEADTWNFYQAKRTKAYLMEMFVALGHVAHDPEKVAQFKAKIKESEQERAELKAKANQLAAEAQAAEEASDHFLGPYSKLAQALIFLQIAISLSSITALTRKRWLFAFSLLGGVTGLSLACYAWWLL